MDALSIARNLENLNLDGSYTGKTLAALISHSQDGRLQGKNVLFWNTLNSSDFSDTISDLKPEALPGDLQRYFSQPVQTLDA